MLDVVTTGAYYPPVVTTLKIFTAGASYLTTGTLCTGPWGTFLLIINITTLCDLLFPFVNVQVLVLDFVQHNFKSQLPKHTTMRQS